MKSQIKSHLIAALVTLIVAAVGFYFTLPAISIHNPGLLLDIVILITIYCVVYLKLSKSSGGAILQRDFRAVLKTLKIPVIAAVCAVAIFAIGALWGEVIFNAKRYRELLSVETGDFQEDVDTISYNQIPTLDSASAIRLGDKKMGELSDIVSQFSVVESYYTQINYNGTPVRVTPLEYVDVFKWLNNVKDGIPGYIMINMVSQDVSVVRFSDLGCGNMKYSTSEHFQRNLYRHLRFKYPTYIFEEPTFEVDDSGIPYWVCSRVDYKIGLYGGRDIGGVVLVNAIDGSSTYYPVSEVPSWVDRVYNAELIIEQFDYYGTLRHGFWNSVFGQKDCRETTDGYNYVALDDDVYMYTGVTSVAADQSNIGFILTNQRTKETKFYEIAGAEEFSAMRSAEGEVQNLRYESTFPLLLNIGSEPTYFVALKDNAGLVKMYAMVNVRQYQIVATGQTLRECEENYIKLIRSEGISSGAGANVKELEAPIADIRTAVVDGNSYYYFRLENSDKYFSVSVSSNGEIVTYNISDVVKVQYNESESAVIPALEITRR